MDDLEMRQPLPGYERVEEAEVRTDWDGFVSIIDRPFGPLIVLRDPDGNPWQMSADFARGVATELLRAANEVEAAALGWTP